MKKQSVFYYQYRSAVSGAFVKKRYAECHPRTTVRIRRRRKA